MTRELQTFLPYGSDFKATVQCLDRQRLGKQRVECKQIYIALTEGRGWVQHPATIMWRGYEMALCWYAATVCSEWIKRGYKDTLYPYFREEFFKQWEQSIGRGDFVDGGKIEECYPPWIDDPRLASTHRGNLLRKDPEHYGKFGWTETACEGYWWPGEFYRGE